MNAKQAVSKRILQICNDKEISINALANLCGISPSTIYSMINDKSKNPGIVTIKKICDGFEITLGEFFNHDIFNSLEQEIF